jgi:uncharacterized membrane protein required for colicin V production
MNTVDWILVALVVGAVFEGLSRGLIAELLDLAAFVVSLAVAFAVGSAVGTTIDRVLALPEQYRSVIGLGLTLSLLTGLIRSLLRLIGRIVPSLVTASLPNRILGVVPALARQLLFVGLVLHVLVTVPLPPSAATAIGTSRFGPTVLTVSQSLQPFVDRLIDSSVRSLRETVS